MSFAEGFSSGVPKQEKLREMPTGVSKESEHSDRPLLSQDHLVVNLSKSDPPECA